MNITTKKCVNCNKIFQGKGNQFNCSQKCRSEWKKKKRRQQYLKQKYGLTEEEKREKDKLERFEKLKRKIEEENRKREEKRYQFLNVGDVITMKCAVKNDDKSEDRYGYIYEDKTLMKVSSDKYFKNNADLYYKLKSSEIPKKLNITVLTKAYIDYYIEENVIEFFEEV